MTQRGVTNYENLFSYQRKQGTHEMEIYSREMAMLPTSATRARVQEVKR